MNSRTVARRSPTPRRVVVPLVMLTALSQLGCGREFFRQWANQDVSEAVFEKSRDPRFKLDLFSVDPPWMSRFADPYDPDNPPSPPDDLAAQSLSPVPQSPYNRLLVPLEGTGYLAMLEEYRATNAQAAMNAPPQPPPAVDRPGMVVPSPTTPPPTPATPSPFTPSGSEGPTMSGTSPRVREIPPVPGANSGPTGRESSPILAPGRVPTPAPPRSSGPQARVKPRTRDTGVRLAAAQAAAATPPAGPTQGPTPSGAADRPAQRVPDAPENPALDPLRTPRIPGDDGPREVQDLSRPGVNPRPDLTPRENAEAEAATTELLGLLGTGIFDFDDVDAAGLKGRNPYVVNMAQAFTLGLINARVYQTQLEAIYLAALPVTLQRFVFAPQFTAGLSPSGAAVSPTALGGPGLGLAVNPTNAFNYRTRATGFQQSTLNLGTVAAVGKNLDNGVKILASFASQVVFNFTGRNPRQPAVQSYLPLSVVVPFLRGGGRAVTLEGLTQAERNLLYQIRTFALFRQQFTVATLIGGQVTSFGTGFTTPGFSVGGNTDPTIGFVNVVEDFQLVENALRNVRTFEQFATVYKELIRGEASGLTKLQLDQLDLQLQNARFALIQSRLLLRNDLDGFKLQLGLPPDVPLIVDRTLTSRFKKVYEEFEAWSRRRTRDLSELVTLADGLPALEDVMIDGRSCKAVFESGNDDNLEDLLLATERISLENRLDLMNTRARLYDAWRQLKVTANALKGVFNVAVTNEILTPPTTTNPFAFVSQAKQFSLVLNAELPLVRVAERNAFRSALISYQQARRSLMNAEDSQKAILRQEIRVLQTFYLQYQLLKRNLVLSASQKDQAFETITAPPVGGAGAGGGGGNANGAIQTQNLIQAQGSLINVENQLVSVWYSYQVQRLTVYRDLGILPYDEWEAFYELYPSEYAGRGAGDADTGGAAAGPAAAGPAPAFGRP